MRLGRLSVLWLALVAMLVACSGAFGAGHDADDAGGEDASEEPPKVYGVGGDSGSKADGTTAAEAGHADASMAGDAGTMETGSTGAGEAGEAAETGAAEAGPTGCATGDLECSGACVPSDVHNCGSCGHDCTNLAHVSGATTCTSSGQCSFPLSACATGWSDCDGKADDGCETDVTKPAACGSCTNACTTSDPVCAGGTCVTGCPAGTPTLCSGACVDTTSNANDCNGCGLECSTTVSNAQPTCASSKCSFTCNQGFSGCPTAAPTACVDETSDPGNCNGCGVTCPGPTTGPSTGQAACANSKCTLHCTAGLTACPATPPATGIPTECTDTTTDLNNCGTCLDVCTTPVSNAHPTCAASTCGFACNSGFQLCGTNQCIPDADTVNGAFVSGAHGGGSACTATQPCATIAAAIATGKTILYLDAATYTEVVALPAASLAVHGGWAYTAGAPQPWTNCGGTNATSIIAAPAGQSSAVTAAAAGTWTLDTLTIENDTTATTSQSLYGVHASAGALTLTNVSISVAAGGIGAGGSQGMAGSTPTGTCTPSAAGSCSGVAGPAGTGGSAGSPGSYSAAGFAPGPVAGTGATGNTGCNGSAGGDGNPYTSCGLANDGDGCGSHAEVSGPGLPGCGGTGGGGGSGGAGGGASIGVFSAGTVTFGASVTIKTGAGGTGGPGGPGGGGGSPLAPAAGGAGSEHTGCANTPSGCKPGGATPCGCSSGNVIPVAGGTAGGAGAPGSTGGAGGGGGGGDSFCYATASGGASAGATVTCNHGSGGTGGSGGNQGTTGNSG
jgi:hypothetical protein